MMYTTIIPVEDLLPHLNDEQWVIVDCRFDLVHPEWGYQSYLEKHIPGAVYANLDHDLSSTVNQTTGRHPLPDIKVFAEWLGSLGISNHSQVIVYDTAGGSIAARFWWLLRYLGHRAVALLDGGFGLWEKMNLPVSSGIQTHTQGHFIENLQTWMAVDAVEVECIRQNPDYILIDARSPERFHGEVEPIDTVAGHIPGAVNRFHALNLTQAGLFKPADTLKQEFNEIIGATPPGNVVVYCGSGVTSCHHIVALEMAGYQGIKLYPGSWSEWIRDPRRPLETK